MTFVRKSAPDAEPVHTKPRIVPPLEGSTPTRSVGILAARVPQWARAQCVHDRGGARTLMPGNQQQRMRHLYESYDVEDNVLVPTESSQRPDPPVNRNLRGSFFTDQTSVAAL